MLKYDEDAGLFPRLLEEVQDIEARHAFIYLVGWGLSSKAYECYARVKGYIHDARFVQGDEWHFAFIPNQKWLLFYFRKPCLHLPKYARERIMQWFPSAQETNQGEFTVRVTSLEDALRIVRYVES